MAADGESTVGGWHGSNDGYSSAAGREHMIFGGLGSNTDTDIEGRPIRNQESGGDGRRVGYVSCGLRNVMPLAAG